MGPEEEDGIFVGRWFDGTFWKLVNLRDSGRQSNVVECFLLTGFLLIDDHFINNSRFGHV